MKEKILKNNLNRISITSLKKIYSKGGDVMKVLTKKEKNYLDFGEVYFTWIKSNSIKAWKKHKKMTMNLVVPVGKVKFVFFSENKKKFRVAKIGYSNYKRITIPPGIWFGFQGIANTKSLVLNFSNVVHNPEEVESIKKEQIYYNWRK